MTTTIQNLSDLQDRRIMMDKKLPPYGYAFVILTGLFMIFLVIWSTQTNRIYVSQNSGVVQAANKTYIMSSYSGSITELNIAEGTYVNEGDLIAHIKSTDLDMQQDSIQSQLDIYKKQKSQYEKLVKSIQDDKNYFSLFSQLVKHFKFTVRLKTGKNPGGVVVVEQLAAKLEVELVVELCDALPDVLGLHLKIFRVVKAFFHGMLLFLILQLHLRHIGGAAGRRVTQTLYSIAYDRLRRNYFLRASSCSRCSNSSSSSMSSFRNIRQKLTASSRQENQMAFAPQRSSVRLPRPAPSANRRMMPQ